MLLGLVHPDAGVGTFDGRRYEELERPSTHVGAVLEEASFHPGRTGRNHLRVLAAAGGHPDGRVDEVLELVELTGAADRRVKGYSMGMRQRLAIAAALLGDRPCSSSTSRRTGSTRPESAGCGICSGRRPHAVARCWSRATCFPRSP
jgi:ABC-type multidrug transport system ATPase subunit